MNTRLRHILRELLAETGPVSSRYLAKVNQVTSRTTRSDMKQLNDFLSENGGAIQTVMGKGYQLEITNDHHFRSMLSTIFHQDKLSTNHLPRHPEERIVYIMKRLLLQDDYVKLESIADEIYISKSTIQNDMKEVRKRLQTYQLSLEARPNHGLKVTGDELNIRFCMAEYIFDRKEPIIEVDSEVISSEDMNAISKIVLDQIHKHRMTLSDIAVNNLAIHMLIAYYRVKSGKHVNFYQKDLLELTDQTEYTVAKEMVHEVESTYQITFPTSETAYVAMHLLGTRMITQSSDQVEHMMDPAIVEVIRHALQKVEEKLNLHIAEDQELFMALYLHIKPAIHRFKYGMNIRNPMLEDIKQSYPLAYEAAIVASLAIEKQTSITIDENEMGYVAIHIGSALERRKLVTRSKKCLIVCASGLGTSQLIYYKLQSQFGQSLDIVGATEYYLLHQFDLGEIDFIISSIPIEEKQVPPVIEVNAILTHQDFRKIESHLLQENQEIEQYFDKELTFLRQQLTSMDDVLHFLNEKLEEKKLVDPGFLEAIHEREEVAPTAYGNLVAIPHPITPKTRTTFLTICTLKQPIMWMGKPVQLVCLLCVAKNSREDLQNMYNMLGKVIESRSIVQQMVKATDYADIRKILQQQTWS
ncbi:BigG family transcription antiterminator [Gracilibacillus halophilus YIM-C55.5]|uniref:BigG family transcription antiterminator n=1 Tax=Gracilibacillus halophilus YIM-C55.5 TaxID=1308866 RepID=N4WUL0_9BACI|nr:BglG family transcription antiterminator [Gracilibacillus halophilus]ENH98020.1 BigG family transcription antiterminator [Gracilibacillus halophilus YIM-C55.5]